MARPASTERLSRILALVPWVLSHPEEATVETVCERFNIGRSELLDDLNMLFVCGKPPFEPGDLIEAGIENDHVVIRMADYLARPLRLTRWEALALFAAGVALMQLPGLEELDALATALAKLAGAIAPGEQEAAALLAERVAIELAPPPPEIFDALRDAIERRRRITLEYYSFGRDDLTTRDVDPLLVFGTSPWYLIAYDHRSKDRRTFRLDRIRSLKESGDTFDRPERFDPAYEAEAPLYHPGRGDVSIVLDLSPFGRWVSEVTPVEHVQELADGWTRVTLKASSTAWLARLVLQLRHDVRIVEPASLRQDVTELARRALARYVD